MRALIPPFGLGDREPPMGSVPAVGEHTDSVLAELGYSRDEIERLREAGAIGRERRSSVG
jgi:crotonobetainyl-CoA:carnitine CoA-transferase CaiB-like acyl-CoA transferase